MTEKRACPICGKAVAPSKTRPRVFCSPAHRTASYDLEQRALQLTERAVEARAAADEAQATWEAVRARKEATT